MPNSQIYNVFLIKSNSIKGGVFLFSFKQDPLLRPSMGDVLTSPITFEQFKILRDELPVDETTMFRYTDENNARITDDEDEFRRVIQIQQLSADKITHNYFVTPANNTNRIVSWSTNTFDDDQTLKQLFR